MPSIKLGPIIIGVKNIEKAKIFYENVFELKIHTQSKNYLSCYLGETHIELEEDSNNRFPNWAKHNIGTYKNSQFIVENIDEFVAKVVQFRGKVISLPRAQPWGGINAEIADPDRNIFLISQEWPFLSIQAFPKQLPNHLKGFMDNLILNHDNFR